jgi:hypothetical protein
MPQPTTLPQAAYHSKIISSRSEGLVHYEFVPPGQSAECYAYFYMQVLQRLLNEVWRKQFNMRQGQQFVHYENAPSHTSLVVQQFLSERNIPVITQPLHSPDLTPSDFRLFPTLKIGLKVTHFTTMEDIKSNVMAESWKIPKETFHRCIQQLQDQGARESVCVCVRCSFAIEPSNNIWKNRNF